MSLPVIPVVLCGGSGTLLWPLSRESYPKQFLPLLGEKSLLQQTMERLDGGNSMMLRSWHATNLPDFWHAGLNLSVVLSRSCRSLGETAAIGWRNAKVSKIGQCVARVVIYRQLCSPG
jgi:hypothetical protein